jgi:hypothetical protein
LLPVQPDPGRFPPAYGAILTLPAPLVTVGFPPIAALPASDDCRSTRTVVVPDWRAEMQ